MTRGGSDRVLALISGAAVALAIILGLLIAGAGRPSAPGLPSSDAKAGSAEAATGKAPSIEPSIPSGKVGTSGAWKPPEGDPLERYLAGKTPKERSDTISNFMALGHDRNRDMLRQAFYDPALEVRRTAIESVTALTDEESGRLLPHAVANDMKDIREMGWDILSRHPAEVRSVAYRNVMVNGPDDAFNEVFDEMLHNPEREVFEGMLDIAPQAPASRQPRLLQEVQKWLREPSGSEDVPQFRSLPDAQAWWRSNRGKFDEWMLRID